MSRRDVPRGWLVLPLAMALGVGVLVLAVIVSLVTGDPIGMLTRDASTLSAETTEPLPPYAGAVGMLTYIVWGSASALALLVAWLVPERRRWLLLLGVLLALLAADDALSVHEQIAPELGVPELVAQGSYAVLAAILTLSALRRARSSRHIDGALVAFLLGGGLLAASLAADTLLVRQHLLEDGPKLLGALAWLTVPVLCIPAHDPVGTHVRGADDAASGQ